MEGSALRLNPYVKFMRGQRAVSRGIEQVGGEVEGAKKARRRARYRELSSCKLPAKL